MISGAPPQRDWTRNRVAHGRARTLRFEIRGLQLEIPAGLAVRVVHQHHAVFIFQAEDLFFDYLGILADESRAHHLQNKRLDLQ
jgi:hypothetical protein